jgi:hypothetical protein
MSDLQIIGEASGDPEKILRLLFDYALKQALETIDEMRGNAEPFQVSNFAATPSGQTFWVYIEAHPPQPPNITGARLNR